MVEVVTSWNVPMSSFLHTCELRSAAVLAKHLPFHELYRPLVAPRRCFQERSQIRHVHRRDDDLHGQHASARECCVKTGRVSLSAALLLSLIWIIWILVASQGLSFHLGAVLITLGFITYVEHGETRFSPPFKELARLCSPQRL